MHIFCRGHQLSAHHDLNDVTTTPDVTSEFNVQSLLITLLLL